MSWTPMGRPVLVWPQGTENAADPGERGGDGVDVGEIHGHGVVDLFAEAEGWGRGHGGDDDVAGLEGLEEVSGEEGADLLGLGVEGVVVAGGEA